MYTHTQGAYMNIATCFVCWKGLKVAYKPEAMSIMLRYNDTEEVVDYSTRKHVRCAQSILVPDSKRLLWKECQRKQILLLGMLEKHRSQLITLQTDKGEIV